MKESPGKRTWRIAALFSGIMIMVLIIIPSLTVSILVLLAKLGVPWRNPILPFFVFLGITFVFGLIVARHGGKKPLAKIIEISSATQKVAQGNFDVKIDEDSPVDELRVMAENFNRMTRELSQTEILRNDFIENVSHEFKTPLTAIEGYVTLLQRIDLTEEKRREYTQKILYNTQRLSALTGNILLLSRLEHQEQGIKREPFALDEQLREIILSLESQWEEKEIALDLDLEDCVYYGNRDLLENAWLNIIGNAVKFAPSRGTVGVSLHKKERCVTVAVSDNGPGMSPETRNRIFEKFYQGDTSRSSRGNGLGLTLAKRTVDLHGGTITVESEEGKGSVFTVTLP